MSKTFEVYDKNRYLYIHDLVYEYKGGSTKAGEILLDLFAKFFTNYAMLIKYGKYNINYFSTRSFMKLFIEDKFERRLVHAGYYRRFGTGKEIIYKTINTIINIFNESTYEDIIQDLQTIFLTMCSKYKDTAPTFHTYVNRNFHFYAYRYWEKTIRDPVGRGSTISIFEDISDNNHQTGKITYSDVLFNEHDSVEVDYTLNNINSFYNIKNSKVPIINLGNKNVYDNNYIDENWINGATCDNKVFKILTPLERKIIKYWYVDNLTDTEISKKIGLCRGNINKRRNIAKKKIIDYINKEKSSQDF